MRRLRLSPSVCVLTRARLRVAEIAKIEHLAPLKRLQQLNLSNNRIEIVENLRELTELRHLVLAGNRMYVVRVTRNVVVDVV